MADGEHGPDDNVFYVEFDRGEVTCEPLENLERQWKKFDRIIRAHLQNQGNELALRRIDNIERGR